MAANITKTSSLKVRATFGLHRCCDYVIIPKSKPGAKRITCCGAEHFRDEPIPVLESVAIGLIVIIYPPGQRHAAELPAAACAGSLGLIRPTLTLRLRARVR